MSATAWNSAFYPIRADLVSAINAGAALELKWTGLSPKNLAKYGLAKARGMNIIYRVAEVDSKLLIPPADRVVFSATADTCVWCHMAHMARDTEIPLDAVPLGVAYHCLFCPAVQAGVGSCSDVRRDYYGPYNDWVHTGNTWSIISWIRRARERIEKRSINA